MFNITATEQRSLAMRQRLNSLRLQIHQVVAIATDVSLRRDQNMTLVAIWHGPQDHEFELDIDAIYQGRWILKGTPGQVSGTRILDALNKFLQTSGITTNVLVV